MLMGNLLELELLTLYLVDYPQYTSSMILNTKIIDLVLSLPSYRYSILDGCSYPSHNFDTIIWDFTYKIAKKWFIKVHHTLHKGDY